MISSFPPLIRRKGCAGPRTHAKPIRCRITTMKPTPRARSLRLPGRARHQSYWKANRATPPHAESRSARVDRSLLASNHLVFLPRSLRDYSNRWFLSRSTRCPQPSGPNPPFRVNPDQLKMLRSALRNVQTESICIRAVLMASILRIRIFRLADFKGAYVRRPVIDAIRRCRFICGLKTYTLEYWLDRISIKDQTTPAEVRM